VPEAVLSGPRRPGLTPSAVRSRSERSGAPLDATVPSGRGQAGRSMAPSEQMGRTNPVRNLAAPQGEADLIAQYAPSPAYGYHIVRSDREYRRELWLCMGVQTRSGRRVCWYRSE
jgi:hypothetical protein